MKVITAKSAGFCFGVKNAVQTANKMAEQHREGERLIMLGELTHNEKVTAELLSKGFEIINDAKDVPEGSTVIIRAHGVTPEQKRILNERNVRVFDCTCPFVEKIHKIVRDKASEGCEIILTGTPGHPEVEGIKGESPDSVVVISSPEELEGIEYDPAKTVLISQTTFSTDTFAKICADIENKIAKDQIFDTICSTTLSRQREAMLISEQVDVMLVIGSAHSSNTRKLHEIAESRCCRTFLVSDAGDVRRLIDEGKILKTDTVGVTAGASTPEAIILEVVQTMDENEKEILADQEQTDTNFAEYIESIPQLRRNAVVKGEITSADADFVYVDIHDKSDGKIPRREFAGDADFNLEEAIANKQEVTVVIKSIKNTDQGKEILLSKSALDFEKNKAVLQEAFENKTPVTAVITSTVKDGVIANFGGIDIYIHKTQIKMGEVKDLDALKGQQIEILITKFDTEKHRLRVSGSHRQILIQERKAKEDEIWNNIEVGKHYTGVVRSLPAFGAFIDIGGVDGLVHITELSWKRISKPSDVLSIGQEVDVYVKNFDKETKKISLGYKKEEDDPFYNIEERIPVGAIVKGTVVRITDFGAFVQLEPDLDALCHVSQISNVRLKSPADVLTIGQEVTAKVTSIKPEDRKISISIKEVEPIDPAEDDFYSVADSEPTEAVVDTTEQASEEAPAEE
ncbi:MAG: bifunctional 4-hydroxy-3-methylbut-2-enyl diphosphate reductase/30S ribosomal protein S1 [Clostridiales bacterium]|nr:bifunctional 4-hydroxy-3-methylbut-2-enyl diphosphate reductase/30S ribosomal protein S1 [Clostridiales bacterium]MBP3810143.1 bifunctional 4-hydroxy-3-methylbut-2-enyl diphosphate reductase/30S ribosomal protein S1 [Clostridiales bacterium]